MTTSHHASAGEYKAITRHHTQTFQHVKRRSNCHEQAIPNVIPSSKYLSVPSHWMSNRRATSFRRQDEDQLSPRFRTQSTLGSCLARRSLATRGTHGSQAELRETTRVAAKCWFNGHDTVICMRSMVKYCAKHAVHANESAHPEHTLSDILGDMLTGHDGI